MRRTKLTEADKVGANTVIPNWGRGYRVPTGDYVGPMSDGSNLPIYIGPSQTYNAAGAGVAGTTSKSKVGDWFTKAKGIGSDILGDIAFTADNFFNPSAGGGISYGFNPWSKAGRVNIPKGKTGLNIGNLNVGKWSNLANAAMQGIDAVGGLSEMSDLNKDAESLESNIIASAAGNPLLSSYLTSDQLSLLGKLRRGTYDGSAGLGGVTSNVGNLFSGAASGAMSGALGGLPGMLIGGIGGLINSGIDNINAETSSNTAQLEALYQSLLDAEQQYKSMKRPNFSGLGIQQRYQNMYA